MGVRTRTVLAFALVCFIQVSCENVGIKLLFVCFSDKSTFQRIWGEMNEGKRRMQNQTGVGNEYLECFLSIVGLHSAGVMNNNLSKKRDRNEGSHRYEQDSYGNLEVPLLYMSLFQPPVTHPSNSQVNDQNQLCNSPKQSFPHQLLHYF